MIAEALVPVFFVMFLGYFAGARRIIDDQHRALSFGFQAGRDCTRGRPGRGTPGDPPQRRQSAPRLPSVIWSVSLR